MRFWALVQALILAACATYPAPKGPEVNPYAKHLWQDEPYAELPLAVWADPSIEPQELQWAIDTWNETCGYEVFSFVSEPLRANVLAGLAPLGSNLNGVTYLIPGKSPSVVQLNTWFRYETFLHELGHAAGLDHDPDDRRSIMYPTSSGRYMTRIQPIDCAAIKWLHTPR